MANALEAARAAWPTVELDSETFSAYLAERDVDSSSPHLSDLYLACACRQRTPAALAEFERVILGQLEIMLARVRTTPTLVDEVAQVLREKLFVGEHPKIAEYSGRGTLHAFIRVVAVRVAFDLKRLRGERADGAAVDHALPIAANQESHALRNRYAPLFRGALESALAALSTDERTLVKLYYSKGLTFDEIGRLFQTHRSTICRRLNACTRALQEAVRDRLAESLGVNSAEFDSLADALLSDLELSLSEERDEPS
jgi:RNA polymerase sigma-70 factor (ECF subfamily)